MVEMINKEELKKKLTKIQYNVTQEQGTERAFTGKYWKFSEDGIYSCIVCDNKLFKSEEKFDSDCGWPAFSNESYKETIEYVPDNTHGMTRVEVRCKKCGAHLGHVFEDGPQPTGLRFCVNSASLNFNKA